MARPCTICEHKQRGDIERDIVDGVSIRLVAARYGTSRGSVLRHKKHVAEVLATAKEAAEVVRIDSLFEQVRSLRERALHILDAAERKGKLTEALMAIREVRGVIELMAKIEGSINDRPQVNVLVSAEWTQLRTLIMRALEPHQEARAALCAALSEAGHADG